MKRQQTFNIKGMTRDISPSRSNGEYAYDIKNMRLTAQEGETLLALVNEKGNKQYTVNIDNSVLKGTIIGYCVIDNLLTLFTHEDNPTDDDKSDNIYRLSIVKDSNTLSGTRLYNGDLGFKDDVILETLGIFESESIKKVYWIDGIHQPRFINIAADDDTRRMWKRQETPFDFIAVYDSKESVSITKTDYSGAFPAGTVQYAMSYYNLNGQQTNIFYTSPLYYTSHGNRGAAADETVSNSFSITIDNADCNFDYLRIYRIMRTTANDNAICRILQDIPITRQESFDSNGNAVYKAPRITLTDTGTFGTSVDPFEILYAGGREIIPECMAQKDNTLFLGNFSVKNNLVPEDISNDLQKDFDSGFSYNYGDPVSKGTTGSLYMYENQLSHNSQQITTFKGGETYRFGLILQDDKGAWSNVIYLGDKYNNLYPNDHDTTFNPVKGQMTISKDIVNKILENKGNYRKARGVVVYPTYSDREVICQGVLSPTVYNITDRKLNQPYGQSSWFFRDMHLYDPLNDKHLSYAVQNSHNWNISMFHAAPGNQIYTDSEIYGASTSDKCASSVGAENNPFDYYVDWNLLTLNTPELDFEDAVFPNDGLKLRIVGAIPLTSCSSDAYINTSTAPQNTTIKNFRRNIINSNNLSYLGNRMRISDFDWYDNYYDKDNAADHSVSVWKYPVMPWQRSTSLVTQYVTSDTNNWISEINTKIISNIRTSALTLYLNDVIKNGSTNENYSYDISSVGIYNGSTALSRLSKDDNDTDFTNPFNYYGEVDSLLIYSNNNGYRLYALPNENDLKFFGTCKDSIRMKYKSGPHAAFKLNYTKDHRQTILPSLKIGSLVIGKQSNEEGTYHWANEYDPTDISKQIEGAKDDDRYSNAKKIVARIAVDPEGNIIDNDWVKNHISKIGIDGINGYDLPYQCWVDESFLKECYPDNIPPNVGDIIIFPNVTAWSDTDINFNNTMWAGKPMLYRVEDQVANQYTHKEEDGIARALYPMGSDITSHNGIGYWTYNDKSTDDIYLYEVTAFDADGKRMTDGWLPAILRSKKNTKHDESDDISTMGIIDGIITKDEEGNIIDDAWKDKNSPKIQVGQYENKTIELPSTGQQEDDGYTSGSLRTLSNNFVLTSIVKQYIPYPSVGNTIIFPNIKWDYTSGGAHDDPVLYRITSVDEQKCRLCPYTQGENPPMRTIEHLYYGGGYWSYTSRDLKTRTIYVAQVWNEREFGVSLAHFYKKITDTSEGGEAVDSGHLAQRTLDLGTHNSASIQFATSKDKCYGFLYIGELYRNIDKDALFGGKTESALQNNKWNVAGKSVELAADKDVVVPFEQGDTYYQRYDSLKTYPYTNQDSNQIVEILSFMCETRVNIDGRYDANRGQSSNLNMRPENFNLLNKVYTQNDNFFSSSYLDYRKNKVNTFRNSILWSKTKTLGEDVDSWTNIQQTSVLDLDGDKGKVNALKNFNDNLLSFQDNGIARILYNERVQINASDGVPIEIANSGKVQGKQYISDHIGCTNKRTIQATSSGLYFMDGNSKDIYILSDGIKSLSKAKGFNSWLYNRDFSKYRTFFDEKASDIYFIDDTSCLVYSEQLGEFTGFYSYEGTDFMFNLDDHLIAIKDNSLWHQFAGDYNYFFGSEKVNYQPFYVTVIANQGLNDKIFGTIDFLADSWDEQNGILNNTFDSLSAWNEYQLGYSNLKKINDNKKYYWSSLKRKFRIWRADIPRAMHIPPTIDIEGITKLVDSIEANEGNINEIPAGYEIKKSMERIRSTWAYIRLSMQLENKNKTILHNLTVNYYN